MPELPEVETIRRQLSNVAIGKRITNIDVIEKKSFIGQKSLALDKPIKKIGRRAKVLQIIFGDDSALLIHFKMTGQLFWQKHGEFKDARFTRVILRLNDGSRLLFNDPRKFGWVKAVTDIKKENSSDLVEPFKENFTLENFQKILLSSRKAIKLVLMDQDKIGGIGNIYANESLFKARINPLKPANSLTDGEAARLHRAILEILQKAIACFGSSGKDEWFRQLNGEPGCYQKHFLVYQKENQKCPGNCNNRVKRVVQGGRGTFYCPKCQK